MIRRWLVFALALIISVVMLQPAYASTTVLSESFNKDAKSGTVASIYHSQLWTGAEFGNADGKYSDSNLSVHGGVLDLRAHNRQGAYVAFDPTHKGTGYGTYTFSMKVTGSGKGYGVAALLWPKGDDPRNGEVDLLEGDLDKHPHIYLHATDQNCRVADSGHGWYCPNYKIVDFSKTWKKSGWQKVVCTWTKDSFKIEVSKGNKKTLKITKNIPHGPHALIIQMAAKNDAKTFEDGHVLIGSVSIKQ